MPYDIGEKFKIVQAVGHPSATDTALTGQGIPLADVNRVSILVGVDNPAVTPTSAVTIPGATLAQDATVAVYVGPATDPATAALSGATLAVGMATAGDLSGWDAIQISGVGTLSTGVSLVIDDTTFTLATGATLADYQLSASAATAFQTALATAIPHFLPHLEVYDSTDADSGVRSSIRRKLPGPGFNASVTAISGADGIDVMGLKQTGVIEFTAADVVATNSSYTHFSVQIDSSATVVNLNAMAVLESGHNQVNSKRTKL